LNADDFAAGDVAYAGIDTDSLMVASPAGCKKHSVARLGFMFFLFLTCPPNKSKNKSIPAEGILINP
jgi:hypothetical protein